MKNQKKAAIFCLTIPAMVCLLVSWSASAGDKYNLKVSGKCEFSNGAGEIATTPLTSSTMIQDCAGTTNNFALVYELNASENSDVIAVVNTLNGEVFCIPFQLFPPTVYNNFDGSFVVVAKGDQTETRRIRYFFGNQSNHGVGTIYLTIKTGRSKTGVSPKTTITGNFRYFVLPEGTNALKICSGTFTASQKFNP